MVKHLNSIEEFRSLLDYYTSCLEKEDMLKELAKLKGSSKHRTTDKQLHEARERLSEEYEKKLK